MKTYSIYNLFGLFIVVFNIYNNYIKLVSVIDKLYLIFNGFDDIFVDLKLSKANGYKIQVIKGYIFTIEK